MGGSVATSPLATHMQSKIGKGWEEHEALVSKIQKQENEIKDLKSKIEHGLRRKDPVESSEDDPMPQLTRELEEQWNAQIKPLTGHENADGHSDLIEGAKFEYQELIAYFFRDMEDGIPVQAWEENGARDTKCKLSLKYNDAGDACPTIVFGSRNGSQPHGSLMGGLLGQKKKESIKSLQAFEV